MQKIPAGPSRYFFFQKISDSPLNPPNPNFSYIQIILYRILYHLNRNQILYKTVSFIPNIKNDFSYIQIILYHILLALIYGLIKMDSNRILNQILYKMVSFIPYIKNNFNYTNQSIPYITCSNILYEKSCIWVIGKYIFKTIHAMIKNTKKFKMN